PHRQRLVAGPCEGLSLEDVRIVVPIRPAHRSQRLRAGRDGRQSGPEKTCGPGEDEALLEEIPAVIISLHGAAPFTMTVCLHVLSLGKRDVAQRARREQLLDLEQVGQALRVICHKTAYDGLAAASLRHCDPAALRATLAAAALMRGLGKREGLPRHRRMPGGASCPLGSTTSRSAATTTR